VDDCLTDVSMFEKHKPHIHWAGFRVNAHDIRRLSRSCRPKISKKALQYRRIKTLTPLFERENCIHRTGARQSLLT